MVAILGFWGLGLPWHQLWLPLIGLGLVGVWVFAEAIPFRAAERLSLVALCAAALALLAFGQHLGRSIGWLDHWYESLEIDALNGVSFDRFLFSVGCLVFLQNTANVIVRLVLKGAGPGVMGSSRTLKGGRILGPLERIFIFAMGLTGQFAAIGAIIAAKGILRSPKFRVMTPTATRPNTCWSAASSVGCSP